MSGMYDGNMAFLDDYESQNRNWLESRPICENCYVPIQDEHYYGWNGEQLCEKCFEEELKKLSLSELVDLACVDEDEIKYELIEAIKKDASHLIY